MSAPRLNRRCLVRGTARRVIIVPSSADSVYEQAIFVLRPEAAREVGPDELLREALDAAAQSLPAPRRRRVKPWQAVCAAAVLAGAAILAILLLV